MIEERIRKLVEDKRAHYEAKRDQQDALAPYSLNEHEKYNFAAEALEALQFELEQAFRGRS